MMGINIGLRYKNIDFTANFYGTFGNDIFNKTKGMYSGINGQNAAPMPQKKYALARCGAALTGGVLLSLLCMGEAAVFYGRMFGWYGWGSLVLPAVVTLLPALVFALGSGWLLGQIRPWLVYVWMAVPFLLAALPLPEVLSLWNGRFFTVYPLTLGTLDPAFALPIGAVAAQAPLLALGAALLAAGGSRRKAMR